MAEIKTLNVGGVNCFLIHTGSGFVLVDTGMASGRARLEKELANAGCRPGVLQLVVLTHGDVDHVDNAAYLRDKYGAKIAMHRDDAGMVERGDMNWNRKARPDRVSLFGRFVMVMSKVVSLGAKDRFEPFLPDSYLEDGQDLSTYGFDAHILHLPGHSKGSLGILTADGDLLCGDLLMNMVKPDLHFMLDDLAAAQSDLTRLKGLTIHTVYPGHGKPFRMEQFWKKYWGK